MFNGKAKKIRLVWLVKIGRKKTEGRNDLVEVDMYEGGGGSCCILSI